MKEIKELIRTRRSIRQYRDKLPTDSQIEEISESGRWAPSGLNNQPWRFLVVKEKPKKDELAKFTKYGDIIRDAPVLILVFMDISDSYNRDKDLMAIGACIQNMLLVIESMGLAACWLGEILNQKQQVHKFLTTDSDLELMAVISLGYSDEDLTQTSRKSLKSLKVKIK